MTTNNDPDGLGCYSDHANDIYWRGECAFCTSTDPDVIGHVLPDIERLTGLDPVQASAMVLHTKGAKMIDGVLLDHFTASAIQAVYNALSADQARAKLRAMTLVKAADVCFRLISKQQTA